MDVEIRDGYGTWYRDSQQQFTQASGLPRSFGRNHQISRWQETRSIRLFPCTQEALDSSRFGFIGKLRPAHHGVSIRHAEGRQRENGRIKQRDGWGERTLNGVICAPCAILWC